MKEQKEISKEMKQSTDELRTKLQRVIAQQNTLAAEVFDAWVLEMEAIYTQNFKADKRFVISMNNGIVTKPMTEANAKAEKARLEDTYPDQPLTLDELQITDEGDIIEGQLVSEEVVLEVIEEAMKE